MADNIFSKFIGFINKLIDPPDEEDIDVDQSKEENDTSSQKTNQPPKDFNTKKPGKHMNVQMNFGKGNLNVHLIDEVKYPKSAKEAVDKIKNNMFVVFNFQDTDQDISQKTIDFISGAAYAIGGDIQKITDFVILFLPMSGLFSQEQKEKIEESVYSSH